MCPKPTEKVELAWSRGLICTPHAQKFPITTIFKDMDEFVYFVFVFHSWVGCPFSRGDDCCRKNRPWICSHVNHCCCQQTNFDSMQEIYMSCENGRLLQNKNFWQKKLTSLLTKIKLLGIVFEFDILGYQQNTMFQSELLDNTNP